MIVDNLVATEPGIHRAFRRLNSTDNCGSERQDGDEVGHCCYDFVMIGWDWFGWSRG